MGQTRWVLEGQGKVLEVEEEHLGEWREIAEAVREWMDLRPFIPETPASWRADRRKRYGSDWVTVMRTDDEACMRHEMVLESNGRVVAAVGLVGDLCPVDGLSPAVNVAVAVAGDLRRQGIAMSLLQRLPSWLEEETGRAHLVGHVCSGNMASLALLRTVGWDHLDGRDKCDRNHHGTATQCDGTSLVFCSGSHDPEFDEFLS